MNAIFLGVVGAAIEGFPPLSGKAAAQFDLAKCVEEVELHEDANALGCASHPIEHEGFARGDIFCQPPVVKSGQKAEAAFHPGFEDGTSMSVAIASPGVEKIHIAGDGLRFLKGVVLGPFIEAKFDADIIVENTPPFFGIVDLFQALEKPTVGDLHPVEFNWAWVVLKLFGGNEKGGKVAAVDQGGGTGAILGDVMMIRAFLAHGGK